MSLLAEHGTFHHVYDFTHFELPFNGSLRIPSLGDFDLTKFMLLQIVAALLVYLIFSGLARRAAGGKVVSGWFWNFWEMLAVYLRDELVRPVIGNPHDHHETDVGHGHQQTIKDAAHMDPHATVLNARKSHPADEFLPFVWSCFFFILFCNLLGALPWAGSATGNISMTAALAIIAFIATFFYGARAHGPIGFWTHLVPSIDAPGFLKPILIVLLFVIEVAGLFIKHAVLAVRLFANMMGGHTALGAILAFIGMAHTDAPNSVIYGMVLGGSLLGQVGVGLLELLVAFIQAYVFAFLSTIFIAMSMHDH
ncbi:F0F1 ATP synthase subunit A [Planctomicrobium piriforme]|uniref:ATP synthase subunit a n=1 Tax=Planctomicrobium piriforme TaxID=1576369 RepID=A0A1I3S7M9_9PLAN|nr:F0F1 ATP synthase subunit A [Planctomicrobium piriforme]SFJ53619.1 F-type H+-transporting ATPase subunit a [Planctomicrobium piriforme]